MSIFKKHPLAVSLSIAFHLLLVGFFVFSVNSNDNQVQSKPPVNIVKATTIDESKIKAEAEKLKNLENKKKLQEKKKIADLKKQQDTYKKKLAKQKADEAAKQAKLKKQKTLAKKKKAADAKKKKLADAKKKKDRLARDKAVKEQANREQALREQAALEEQQMRAQAAVASYSDLIRQKVERNWSQPPDDISGLNCVVRVRLIPGGDVIDAQVIKSSGNAFFDRSVELATRKASPLPLPNDPSMFNYFRTLEFYFRPGG